MPIPMNADFTTLQGINQAYSREPLKKGVYIIYAAAGNW